MLPRYLASGKFGRISLLYVPSLLAGGVGLAWPYAELATRSHSGTLNAGLALVFLACIFGVVWLGMRAGKCRNQWIAAGIGFVVGAASAAAVQYWMYTGRPPTSPPQSLLDFLQDRATRGWRFGKTRWNINISGELAYACWGIEYLLTIIAGMAGGLMVADAPFCEDCEVWANKPVPNLDIPGLPDAVVKSVQQATRVEDLFCPPLGQLRMNDRHLCYSIHVCPRCEKSGFLSVTTSRLATKLNGKVSEESTELHTNIQLEPWHLEAFEELRADVEAQLKMQKQLPETAARTSGRTDVP